MENYNKFTSLAAQYSSIAATYDKTPTKANAKRLRDIINQMQKLAVTVKKELVTADKAGY